MKIKIWEIDRLKEPLRIDYSEDFNYLVKDLSEVLAISPVTVKVKASKITGIYNVKGEVSTTLEMKCSRCLNLFQYNLESDFEELFIPNDVEVNLGEENDEVNIMDSDEIDLTKIVEETVILSIPYVPVCDEDCKGLCPSCGINLNKEHCNCKIEKIDPRLADLSKWFDQKDPTE